MSDDLQQQRPDCIHAGRVVKPDKVECSCNRFAGPDFARRSISEVCDHPCPFKNKPNRTEAERQMYRPVYGLGDWVAGWLYRFGLRKREGCGCGCDQRRDRLNWLIPFDRETWRRRWQHCLSWLFRSWQ